MLFDDMSAPGIDAGSLPSERKEVPFRVADTVLVFLAQMRRRKEFEMENKDLVSRLVNCWESGQVEEIDEILTPNFVRHEPDIDVRNSSREDYKQTIAHLRNMLSGFHTEPLDTIEQDNKVVFRFRTTGKHDNAQIVFEGVNVLRIEGGKIAEDWVYYDAGGLKQRLGQAKASSAAS
jgi:ketosteroid isomerase-like protein